MTPITTTAELAKACESLARGPFVTVDTEFLRETTYWPKLCLIQLAGAVPGEADVIVDPLSPTLDLAPFFALMANPAVVKVFHAARQDVEIIYLKSGIIPGPLFDTQVAAMVRGFGESISYVNLVKNLTGVDIDKSSQFTDWARRPLSPKQLIYALGDVTHLRDVYLKLKADLDATGRGGWVAQEIEILTDPQRYTSPPEEAWRRLGGRVRGKKGHAVLVALCTWREKQAQALDVPRQRVIRDDAIYDIANQLPKDLAALGGLRTLNDGFARSQRGRDVNDIVQLALAGDLAKVPTIDTGPVVPQERSAVVDLLRVLLKARATEHGVAPKLLADTEDLERLVMIAEPEIRALKGWRRMIFGEDALRLTRGEIGLSVTKTGVNTVPLPRADG